MPAAVLDITIEQGATFVLPFELADEAGVAINLTGYSARGQLRRSHDAQDKLVEFSPAGPFDANGTFSMTLSAAQTALLPPETLVYDIELFAGTEVIRLVKGIAVIDPEVTK